MRTENLVNEYEARYGIVLLFNSYVEMRNYAQQHYGDKGFPVNQDIWDQLQVIVLEPEDPEGIPARLRKSRMTEEEIRALGFNY